MLDQPLTDWPALLPKLEALGLRLGVVLFAAVVGTVLVRLAARLTETALARAHIEPTLASFALHFVRTTLTVLLVSVLLGLCGLQLASFAALMAAVGIAIGGAMSGLLGDFAAGMLLLLLRPFEVGDDIAVEGAAGEVLEIGVFRTVLVSDSNFSITIGNHKLLGDVLERRSGSAAVRVQQRLTLQPDADTAAIVATLALQITALPAVLAAPAPRVRMVDYGTRFLVIEIRAFCAPPDEDVLAFAINRLVATLPRGHGEPEHVRIEIATR